MAQYPKSSIIGVWKMAGNVKVLLSGGASRNYGSTLAEKFNSSPIAEFGTSAPLAAIQCYRQAR